MIERRSARTLFVAVVVLLMLAPLQLDEPLQLPTTGGVEAALASGGPDHPVAFDEPELTAPVELPVEEEAPTEPAPADQEIAPPPEEFAEPPPKTAPPPRQLRTTNADGVVPAAGTWAVVIGVNDYPGTRYDLGFAVADANDVDAALARLGVPAANRLVVRDSQASVATIRAAVDWLVAHAGPDAVAVFFYAGHVRKVSATSEALVGSDGGLVTDAELAERFAALQARRAWFAIAACYSGGFTELLAPGRVLTAAASANDLAFENENLGRSYLVEYMVRRAMILNRASATVQSAFLFAHSEIARDYPGRVPVQFDSLGTGLDLRPGSGQPKATPSQPAGSRPGSPPPPPSPPRKTCLLVLSCG